MILENKEEWYRHIIATGSPSEMIELESEILQLLDAKNDSRSFNQSNNDKKFSMSGKQKGPMSQRHKDKLSKSKKGRVAWNKGLTKETNEKVRLNGIRSGNTRKGKPGHSFTPEQRLKIGNTERLTKQNKKRICGAQELDTGITQQDRGLQEVLLRRTKC
jgi:hypothetical protein